MASATIRISDEAGATVIRVDYDPDPGITENTDPMGLDSSAQRLAAALVQFAMRTMKKSGCTVVSQPRTDVGAG